MCLLARALAREGERERESVFILILIHFEQNIFDLPKVSISFKRDPNRGTIMDRNEIQKQNRRQQFFIRFLDLRLKNRRFEVEKSRLRAPPFCIHVW